MKKFKRKKEEDKSELSSFVFEEMVENLYKDIVQKDLARVKYLLTNGIVKEEEIVDAVCFQFLEKRHNSTLIQILLDRKILFGEKYRTLEQIPLETLPTVEMQKQISKKNIYIANMFKEYGVVSQQEATKYLQILQRLRQMGLKYDWKKFAETTKLISPEMVDAIVQKVQEKIDNIELKLNSTERLLQSKKKSLSIGAKIYLVSSAIALLLLPILVFAFASYQTIQDRNAPQKEEEQYVFAPVENVTEVKEVVGMPKGQVKYEKYHQESGYKKWGEYVIKQQEWEELAKQYTPHQNINAKIQLIHINVVEDYEITIKGQFDCPKMPKELAICLNVKIETFQQKIYYQQIYIDENNNFTIRVKNKSLFSLGYHTIKFEIIPGKQHHFTRSFLDIQYQNWQILLQIGSQEQIQEQIKKEYMFLRDFFATLTEKVEQKLDFTAFTESQPKIPELLSKIELNTFIIPKVQNFVERWQKLIEQNTEVEQLILELYDFQIFLTKMDRKIDIYGKYIKKFLLPR